MVKKRDYNGDFIDISKYPRIIYIKNDSYCYTYKGNSSYPAVEGTLVDIDDENNTITFSWIVRLMQELNNKK